MNNLSPFSPTRVKCYPWFNWHLTMENQFLQCKNYSISPYHSLTNYCARTNYPVTDRENNFHRGGLMTSFTGFKKIEMLRLKIFKIRRFKNESWYFIVPKVSFLKRIFWILKWYKDWKRRIIFWNSSWGLKSKIADVSDKSLNNSFSN
jgi:hypothetical protein